VRLQSLPLLTIVFASGCVLASVQKTPGVVGHVLDSRSGKAVGGARVGFSDFQSVCKVTDQEGRFSLAPTNKLGLLVLLPFDPAQKYLPLEVCKVGYVNREVKVPFYSFGRPQENLTLRIEPIK
jgi:hypothetical protein